MPLKTTEAFVIDVRKMQEADRLVTFFTRDEGKIRGVAPSAAKSRRRFGGKLERLSRVRVTYFEKEGRDLARIDSCDLLEESFTLHGNLRAAAALSYVAEVVDTFAREHEADERYFRLVGSVLTALREGGDPGILARYFEVWTLRLHGLMPDLGRCGACERELAGSTVRVTRGDMPQALCPACGGAAGPGKSEAGAVRLGPAAMAALERFRRVSPADLRGASFPGGALSELEVFTHAMLIGFVGHPFRSWKFLREMGLTESETP